MAEMTPMMQQYLQIKEQYKDSILFFRLGDFYEMFFDDAKVASKELELTLTGRDCGQPERAPMCGVPFHSYETYAARLVSRGFKVAICEQVEDPAAAKGLVKRDIIRVITPGTVIEGSMLEEDRNNYLSSVYVSNDGKECGLCFCDCSTGEVQATVLSGANLSELICNELGRFNPSEIIINSMADNDAVVRAFMKDKLHGVCEVRDDAEFDVSSCRSAICEQYAVGDVSLLGLTESSVSVCAIGCAIRYLQSTQMNGLERLRRPVVYNDAQYMKLDITARRNLELVETMRSKEKRGSLLGVLDHTRTAMGKRLMRTWIEQPLINLAAITRRLDGVEELVTGAPLRADTRDALNGVYDLERIMTRIVYGSANARELRSLLQTLEQIPLIKTALASVRTDILREIDRDVDALEDIRSLLSAAIVDDPPFSVREGKMIREGYHAELDLLRADMKDGTGIITRIETEEKEKTGIKTLKVGYNRVFGYYIEVSRLYSDQVPEHYIRKQTLANAERYITQELKELEARVLGARDRSVELEYQLFCQVRDAVADELPRIQSTAEALARLDVLASFAEVSARENYCKPEMDVSGSLHIVSGRHPVVESLSTVPFVPNDTLLDQSDNRVAIITGPNMAGKSTYMRQTALIVLMAQMGSFVPAQSAVIGVVDRVFTRIGASDDLAAGQSTFMVEMQETAAILQQATNQSLLILDEIGRGTSTYDGMAIARAVLEYCADQKKLGAKTMFATHYHELTALEQELEGVRNYNITAKKQGGDLLFLRKIVRGAADDSYGIEVAKLAGLPDTVIRCAKKYLRKLEAAAPAPVADVLLPEDDQISLVDVGADKVAERLRNLDLNTITPIEAMNLLAELQKIANA